MSKVLTISYNGNKIVDRMRLITADDIVSKLGDSVITTFQNGTTKLKCGKKQINNKISFCTTNGTDFNEFLSLKTGSTLEPKVSRGDITVELAEDTPKTLNEMTWGEIKEVCEANQAANYFSVGDIKEIVLNGEFTPHITFNHETAYCWIIGINHNKELESPNNDADVIHFEIGRASNASESNKIGYRDTDVLVVPEGQRGEYCQMNYEEQNTGGWKACDMRLSLQFFEAGVYMKDPQDPDNLLPLIPTTITKYTDNSDALDPAQGSVTSTIDNIFLLSPVEIYGSNYPSGYMNPDEYNYQKQYDYYSNPGVSTVFYANDNSSLPWHSWTRTRAYYYNSPYYFISIQENGTPKQRGARYSLGISPCFCL